MEEDIIERKRKNKQQLMMDALMDDVVAIHGMDA